MNIRDLAPCGNPPLANDVADDVANGVANDVANDVVNDVLVESNIEEDRVVQTVPVLEPIQPVVAAEPVPAPAVRRSSRVNKGIAPNRLDL